MNDIELLQQSLTLDFNTGDGGLLTVRDLENAVLVSLLTDKRLEDGVPAVDGKRGGWWGDVFPGTDNDRTGSLLWTLRREKAVRETANRAREFVQDALEWMVIDGVASSVEVNAQIVSREAMLIEVKILRPDEHINFRYDFAWQAQELKRSIQ